MDNRIDITNSNSRSSSLFTFVTNCISTSFQVLSFQDNKFNNNHLLISSADGNIKVCPCSRGSDRFHFISSSSKDII
jgi:hypothetical protein